MRDRRGKAAGKGTGWGLARHEEEKESELCGVACKKRSQYCGKLPMREGVRVVRKKYIERRHEKFSNKGLVVMLVQSVSK